MRAPNLNSFAAAKSQCGFSLIEVTIALGITAFCLVPIIGMLPVGLRSLKNSTEQAAAAAIVNQIAITIRNASSENGQDFVGYFAGDAQTGKIVSYKAGSGSASLNLGMLALSGSPTAISFDQRFKTQVTILPPSAADPLGTAIISVAWPAASNPTWNASTNKWDNKAEGSVTTAVKFAPRT